MAPHDSAKPASGETRLSAPERRLLATMPLHAITAIHGEDGLRDRLLIEIGRFPAAERARIGGALALMSRLHQRDRRQREAYACHPLRVTIRILSHYHYRVTDADVACAALLHDTVEDHAGDIAPGGRAAALTVLAGQFGEHTAELVAAVTSPPWEPGRDKHEQYREHVAQSLDGSPWARVVKVSDITDNAVGLFPHHRGEPALARRQVPAPAAGAVRARPPPGHPVPGRRQAHDHEPVRQGRRQAPLRGGFASLDPAATHKDLGACEKDRQEWERLRRYATSITSCVDDRCFVPVGVRHLVLELVRWDTASMTRWAHDHEAPAGYCPVCNGVMYALLIGPPLFLLVLGVLLTIIKG